MAGYGLHVFLTVHGNVILNADSLSNSWETGAW